MLLLKMTAEKRSACPKPECGEIKFLLMLCTMAYEPKWYHGALLSKWGPRTYGTTFVRVLHMSCGATIVRHDKLLMVVFKGTSSFDLSQWMRDFCISKVTGTEKHGGDGRRRACRADARGLLPGAPPALPPSIRPKRGSPATPSTP